MQNVSFFNEDISFQLRDENKLINWISGIAGKEEYELIELNYIFCSDNYLLQINRQYLKHDYYTDIITFDNSEVPRQIVSDIFISVDRVQENSMDLKVEFDHELYRVMIHGLLHLMGYNDKGEDDQIRMRKKEDSCLSLLK